MTGAAALPGVCGAVVWVPPDELHRPHQRLFTLRDDAGLAQVVCGRQPGHPGGHTCRVGYGVSEELAWVWDAGATP